jgi:uncharacterized Zn finger protein (UPF0148 family)
MGMFDHTLRATRKLGHGVSRPISIPLDDDGYMDRRCPSEECRADFKVLFDDWKEKVSDDAVFCPLCRNQSEATDWNTPEQSEYIQQAAMAFIQKQIGAALKRDAEAFNRSQSRTGFISVSMSYKPGRTVVAIPCDVSEIMRQRYTCEQCGCRYSSIGSAFFCPACGRGSAESAFDESVQTVRNTAASIPIIRQAIPDRDDAENAVRMVLEQSFDKLVSAYQCFTEAAFRRLPNADQFRIPKNLFQRIDQSSEFWLKATGKGYEDLISGNELSDLKRFFQQRHLLAHRDGIVDQEYIDKSADTSYSVGQRIVVRQEGVLRLADIVSRLAAGLRRLTLPL